MTGKYREYMNQLYQRNKLFFNYALIGVTGVSLDFAVFTILTAGFGVFYQYSNAISVSMGITNNFILNAFYNFRLKDKLLLRFVKFYMVGLLGLGISALFLYIFIECLKMPEILSKGIIILIVTIVQFNLNRIITFRGYNNA